MTTTKEPMMGRFSVELDLANHRDLILAGAGMIPHDQVRRARIRGVVDSGATRLVLPESVTTALGLEISGVSEVRYSDGHTAERAIARDVHLSYGGRESVFSAIVEPNRDSALIGAIVLDCTSQRLMPRDPKQIISEVE
jgi:hypothetical protein